jgi:Na+/H+ antiporter NhaD/arsenite permease-like protein
MSSTALPPLDPTVFVSLAFLFGIASQFRAMDGESFLRRIIAATERRVGILYVVVIVTSIFSPLILNDVVVIILTPVIIRYSKQLGVDIAPLLVAEITFTNIASSLTPLGNPQNILLWSASKVAFLQFVAGTSTLLLASGIIAALAILPLRRLNAKTTRNEPSPLAVASRSPPLYLALVILAIGLSDFSGSPVYVSLGICFALGFVFTFPSPRKIVGEFDLGSLITLYFFVGSVAVVSFLLGPTLGQYAAPVAQGAQPYSALFVGAVSSVISNVPATQLILSVVPISAQAAPKIAVEAGLAGNLDPIFFVCEPSCPSHGETSGPSRKKNDLASVPGGHRGVSPRPALSLFAQKPLFRENRSNIRDSTSTNKKQPLTKNR